MKHLLIILTLLGAAIHLSAQEKSIPQHQIGLWGGIGVGQYINITSNPRSPLGGRMRLWTFGGSYDGVTAIIKRFCSSSPTNPIRSNCYHFFSESVFFGVGLKYDLGR